jgi:hypothetical protein
MLIINEIKMMPSDEYPTKNDIVFATNDKGYIGIVYWDGEQWHCAETKRPVKIGCWIEIIGK